MKIELVFPHFRSPELLELLDIAQQFQKFSTLTPEQQTQIQGEQLVILLRYALKSPFWQKRLSEHQFDSSKGTIDWEWFKTLPTMHKQNLQEDFASLRAYDPAVLNEQITKGTTTGSTGEPVSVERFGILDSKLQTASLIMDMNWHRINLTKSFGFFRHLVSDSDCVRHSFPFNSLGATGTGFQRSIGDKTIAELAEILIDQKPAQVSGSPTLIKLLCQHIHALPIKLNVETVITLGEVVSPELRTIVLETFGAKIIDRYSCGEIGLIALQCPTHNHYHVLNGTVLVEIVDESGNPCPIGKPGNVLVTSLHSYAMPIIRYELGDVAQWGEPCDCGINLPVIKSILGKSRDYITLPDGSRHFVTLGGDFAHNVSSLREHQVRFYELGRIEFIYRGTEDLTASEHISIVYQLQERFGHPWPVTILRVEVIEWNSLWKRREFIKFG